MRLVVFISLCGLCFTSIKVDGAELKSFKGIEQFLKRGKELDIANIFRTLINNKTLLLQNNTTADLDFDGINIRTILKEILPDETNITVPNGSLACIRAWLTLILDLDKIIWKTPTIHGMIEAVFASPLARMIDSFGKFPPNRLLLGDIQDTGAYDECAAVTQAKYCISVATIKTKYVDLQTSYGSCIPKECEQSQTSEMMPMLKYYAEHVMKIPKLPKVVTHKESFLPVTIKGTFCEKPTEYSTGVLATLAVMIILLSFCVVGTLTELLLPCGSVCKSRPVLPINQGLKNDEEKKLQSDEMGSTTALCDETTDTAEAGAEVEDNQIDENQTDAECIVVSLQLPSINNDKPKAFGDTLTSCVTSFSLIKNTRAIVSTEVAHGAIRSLNGIRVISLTWIILGHIHLINIMQGQPDNIANMVKIVHRFTFLVIGNAYVSVDTFFLLSGLLVSYVTLKRFAERGMKCVDVIVFYLHRFLRLTPSLGLVILFHTNILPLTLSGPKGVILSQTDTLSKPCVNYWWSTLFYFNNFYPTTTADICLDWTWYLSNDMQFYIISLPLLLLMVAIEKRSGSGIFFNRKSILSNFSLIMSLCLVSIIITGAITGAYDLPTLATASLVPGNPRMKRSFMALDRIMTKPYCRITPYLIGMFLGYILSRNVVLSGLSGSIGKKGYVSYRKIVSWVGWFLAIVVGLAVVYGPWHVFKEDGTFFSDVENVIYGAFYRFAWGVAVAWVIYACHNKVGGLVNEFLSWRVWIPLSRLTYGAYLLHFIVIEYFLNTKDVPNHYQDTTTVFDFLSITSMSYACAFILAVCVEYPVFHLKKTILGR